MLESVAQSGAANSVDSAPIAGAQPERPGEMRAHLVFSFGAFLESQLLNETKEQGQCSSLSDSSNG